jgi:molybdopterin converting factor small subunit
MATVRIPTPLRPLTQSRDEVQAEGATVGEVIADLEKHYPGIKARLLDEAGGVRRYVNIFHNDEDIRFLEELQTKVAASDRLAIVPAIAGGR